MARADKHREQFFNKVITVNEPKYVRKLLVGAHVAAKTQTTAPDIVDQDQTAHRRGVVIGISFGLAVAAVVINFSLVMQREGTLASVSVGGVEISSAKTDEQLENELLNKIKNFTFSIKKPNQELQYFALAKAGVTIDVTESVKAARKVKNSGTLYQKLQWWHTEKVELTNQIDQTTLKRFVDENTFIVITPAQNASLVIEAENITILPGQNGQAWTVKEPKNQILDSAKSLSHLNMILTKQVTTPKVTTQAIERYKSEIDKVLAKKVNLRIEGQDFQPSRLDILGWIDLPDFAVVNRIELEINSGSVEQYIDTIAKPYVAPGKSQIIMADSEGREVILVQGQNGYDVKNKTIIATDLASNLKIDRDYTADLILAEKDFETVNAADYEKWILVDLTNKQMQAYEGSKLVKSFLVSAGAPATPTVLGEYRIYAQIRRQDMRGLNVDGSSYFQPNVEFVSYFYEGYAIHGNYWRPNWWFGNVNSSHGCVGVVNSDAEWVYNWASVGTPIITHL